jgi:hypothetical protein
MIVAALFLYNVRGSHSGTSYQHSYALLQTVNHRKQKTRALNVSFHSASECFGF